MANPTILIKEYNIIWEALAHYEKYLEQMSLSSSSEDEELIFDEKLQDIESARKTIQYGALNSYGVELK
ncbi:hypothetical protein ACSV5M_21080 [Cellvibrio sp. ARAG 10.3]|jgi:hypothetical protein|uniref:hypothetical protein n=1 Tax=unclassified Cellvibrio TaxID=2624793 RepID=UPI000B3B0F14|nr:hypothetical protein [Cellvibrio sp. PSBB006]ARU26631.1 hypothetical protein CBR65_03865 [Cellvibrio sp. PSBB006]